ncbi:uncharacterized protein LOC143019675 [Oratosquilla oratoria]|uniref:uncharacterized protein LOC143019675 n=1 Tax=Oratosquilla oratoria TaxID=337810 RepID=UPI003F773F40
MHKAHTTRCSRLLLLLLLLSPPAWLSALQPQPPPLPHPPRQPSVPLQPEAICPPNLTPADLPSPMLLTRSRYLQSTGNASQALPYNNINNNKNNNNNINNNINNNRNRFLSHFSGLRKPSKLNVFISFWGNHCLKK